MAEAEQVYGSREVAAMLGVGAAMLRRYAVSYERLSGSALELDRRDGRMFGERDLAVLSQARALVATQGLPVDRALEMVLRSAESPTVPLAGVTVPGSEVLAGVLAQAITEAQRPLLDELRGLRSEVEALRSEVAKSRQLPEGAPVREVPTGEPGGDGPMVRAARWLERRLRGGRG